MGVRDYRELHCWVLADKVRNRVFALTQQNGFDRHLWLRSQLQRATASACSNMAEGFSRYQPRDFGRFLNIAKGSLSETLEHLRAAEALGLIAAGEAAELESLIRQSRGATTGLAAYLRNASPPDSRRDTSRTRKNLEP